MRYTGQSGFVSPNGGWNNATPSACPADYLAAHAGVFSYAFKYFSGEFPENACAQYADHHLALLTTTAAGIPADHNLSLDLSGNQLVDTHP